MSVTTIAPAKINWTLEVLGRREDGYHEVRTVFQTIDMHDTVRVSPLDRIELRLGGRTVGLETAPENNLAHRAAVLLREKADEPAPGALIEVEKSIPVGAGLGGGSSDAAAVMRALSRLWGIGLPAPELACLGSKLGSDVPFFFAGGTAFAQGRGDEIRPLPDVATRRIVVLAPSTPGEGKTAGMYARLGPTQYGDGAATQALLAKLERGGQPENGDIVNVFEQVEDAAFPALAGIRRAVAEAGFDAPHLAGSGPALFTLVERDVPLERLRRALAGSGVDVFETRTLAAADATALREEP
jgi:4-diphosphocytidyl-2-C-methyl-D-erythritol kinase